MARSEPLGLRLTPEVKRALEAAAEAEDRSMAYIVERQISAWLREKGFLK